MSEHQPESRHASGHASEPEGSETEFRIAQSQALIPLLVLAALTLGVVLTIIVRAKPAEAPAGTPATTAFGPSDFPAIFGAQETLLALDSGRGVTGSFPVPAPPFSEGIFPCTTCHADLPPNPERRTLDAMHSEIVFHHDSEHRWCLDCHDEKNRDQLRLANGSPVPFTESYRLCGQCHGTQYRDWRVGIHGKRTGYWDGPKRYLLCVNCHNPHSPRFAALQPLPPPVRPEFLDRQTEMAAKRGEEAAAPRKEDGDAAHAH